jgi:hypothetical protein
MSSTIREISPRQAARIAGYGYLVIFVLAIFSNFVARSSLIETDDAAATAANIADSATLFRSGIVGFLIVFALDVAIAWALYIFFRRVSRDLSLLTAWFRLVYTVMLGVALVSSFMVLQLATGAGDLAAFERAQLDAQVMLFLDAFDYAWLIGLACFGVHLALLGYLSLRSGTVPKAIAALLMLAGAVYVFDTLANALIANYDDYETVFLAIVAVPSLIGEMSFAIWLLMRGGKEGEMTTGTGTREPMRDSAGVADRV